MHTKQTLTQRRVAVQLVEDSHLHIDDSNSRLFHLLPEISCSLAKLAPLGIIISAAFISHHKNSLPFSPIATFLMSLLNVCLPLFGTALHLIPPYSQLSNLLPPLCLHPLAISLLLLSIFSTFLLPLISFQQQPARCQYLHATSSMPHFPLPTPVYLLLPLPLPLLTSLLCH